MKVIQKKLALLVLIQFALFGCATVSSDSKSSVQPPVQLPFIKNSPKECYYLDEFMPVPDTMVPGKSGHVSLRYYTYNMANYKDWNRKKVILSFYSQDDRCWSLFEEYYIAR